MNQWENLKCGISRKWLLVERNGRKFGTGCTTVHIFRVLLMPNSFSLVWGHSVHFVNFQFYNFRKTLLLSQFSSGSSKLYTSYHNHTGCHFFGNLQKNCKNYGTLNFLNTGPYAAGSSNSSHNFLWSPSKLCDNTGYHGKLNAC